MWRALAAASATRLNKARCTGRCSANAHRITHPAAATTPLRIATRRPVRDGQLSLVVVMIVSNATNCRGTTCCSSQNGWPQ
eukprot:2390423-Pyramimonas_sp.AAC.1